MILFFFLVPFVVFGQWGYATVDPDGYTNVRKYPDAQSDILGKISKYHIFDIPDNSCNFDGKDAQGNNIAIIESDNWLPVLITETPAVIGYVYKKYIREVASLPKLKMVGKDSLNASFTDGNINIRITVEPTAEFIKRAGTIDESSPFYYRLPQPFHLKNVSIQYKDKKITLPSEETQSVFFLSNPLITIGRDAEEQQYRSVNVYKREDGIYHLTFSTGDGGDIALYTWIISKEKVVFNGETGHCVFYEIILNK